MVCRLCLEDRPLCDSHIWSEFTYKHFYDEKHRFVAFSNDPEHRTWFPRKGLREPLLCSDCEEKLSKHESYLAKLLRGVRKCDWAHAKRICFQGLDYRQVRLCFLSWIWKMGISSRSEFKHVQLGSKHEERLRKMILEELPGEFYEYGFAVFLPTVNGEILWDISMQGGYMIRDRHHVYRTVIGGLLVLHFVSSHRPQPLIANTFLQEDGSWFWTLDGLGQIDFLAQWVSEAFPFKDVGSASRHIT
jgi:hypothetical protein